MKPSITIPSAAWCHLRRRSSIIYELAIRRRAFPHSSHALLGFHLSMRGCASCGPKPLSQSTCCFSLCACMRPAAFHISSIASRRLVLRSPSLNNITTSPSPSFFIFLSFLSSSPSTSLSWCVRPFQLPPRDATLAASTPYPVAPLTSPRHLPTQSPSRNVTCTTYVRPLPSSLDPKGFLCFT
ncbi:hypothetical protein BKA81DRAFT_94198 [Phyllosticta paracitricarpa]